jgi:ribulose-5-phosphate 4-epimerase/fuculose-1-phosphate aldolase
MTAAHIIFDTVTEEERLRALLVNIGQSLFQRGYAVGSAGNISVRLPDGNILATPTNSCLGRLDPQRLAKITPAGEQLAGDRMSKEVLLHLALYAAGATCGAVVHLHSTYLTALACCENLTAGEFKPFTPYLVMRVGGLEFVPYYKPGSPKIAEELSRLLGKGNRAFILANHGGVVYGSTLEDAVNSMEELEETARLFFILHPAKAFSVKYLTEAEVMELRGVS